jgi:hypothetical protein
VILGLAEIHIWIRGDRDVVHDGVVLDRRYTIREGLLHGPWAADGFVTVRVPLSVVVMTLNVINAFREKGKLPAPPFFQFVLRGKEVAYPRE